MGAMSDTPTNGIPETARPPQSPNGDGWGELRSLLIGPERTQLDQLQARLDALRVYPEDVSQVLAEAIHLRSNQDKQFTNALLPSVEEALRASIQRNPRVLVDTLFPMMGPAIRKAITTALRSMLDSLNRSLAMSLSLRGLKWHWEAFRTGKPFAEIVLLHTLSYRVEQVFLIHKETGLLLQHVIDESVPGQDGEMISGMLTAIQDFMRDSFGGAEGESLDTVEYGDRTLWIEQGPQAILAGVVWGNAPRELKIVFQEALESIHFDDARGAGLFPGRCVAFYRDSSPFGSLSARAAQDRRDPPFSTWCVAHQRGSPPRSGGLGLLPHAGSPVAHTGPPTLDGVSEHAACAAGHCRLDRRKPPWDLLPLGAARSISPGTVHTPRGGAHVC